MGGGGGGVKISFFRDGRKSDILEWTAASSGRGGRLFLKRQLQYSLQRAALSTQEGDCRRLQGRRQTINKGKGAAAKNFSCILHGTLLSPFPVLGFYVVSLPEKSFFP